MKRASILAGLLCGLVLTAPAHAQSQEAAPTAKNDMQTWYVMIALYEPETALTCAQRADKVSTRDPIAVEGPQRVNINHINAVVGQWVDYIAEASPAAYRMINGATGHKTDVYFRRSENAAREAFRRDGHLSRNRRCERSVLITHPTTRFRFSGPRDFGNRDFGVPYDPPPVMAGNVRELARIPGIPEGQ